LLQETARQLGGYITDEEMFRTFNMGWGFAIIVDKKAADEALDVLERTGVHSEQIGRVTSAKGIKILHDKTKITLK
jgi:phosphoribosylformylglycinamidine cyclo-ligase